MSNWPKFQNFLKQINLSKEFSIKKENEIKTQIENNISLYYKNKIKANLITQKNLNFLGIHTNNKSVNDKYKIKISLEDWDLSYYVAIKTFLFELRNNLQLLERFIVDLSLEEEKKVSKIFVNYFFEDLSSCSISLQNFLTYFLRLHMDNIADFVDDDIFLSKKTFLGRFLYELSSRNEIKIYLNQVLKSTILEIDQFNFNCKGISYLTLDYKKIYAHFHYQNQVYTTPNGNNFEILNNGRGNNTNQNNLSSTQNKNSGNIFQMRGLHGITGGGIKKNKRLEKAATMRTSFGQIKNYRGTMSSNSSTISSSSSGTTNYEKLSISCVLNKCQINKISNELFNKEHNLTANKIRNEFKIETDLFMKYFYLKNLQNIQNNKKKDVYSFNSFKSKFESLPDYEELIEIFYKNFTFIENLVSKLLDRILAFNDFCPKIVKFICNSIYTIIKEKYSYLDELTLITFINKFFFEIIFIPNIQYPEKNELISNETIFNEKTHLSLNIICQILTKLSKLEFFDSEDDEQGNLSLVMFNHFIAKNVSKIRAITNDILFTQKESVFFSQNDNEDVYHSICLTKEEIYMFIKRYDCLVKYISDESKYFQMNEFYAKNANNLLVKTDQQIMFHLFIQENFTDERKQILKADEKKEKISKMSNSNFLIENKICIENILVNVPNLDENLNIVDLKGLFQKLDDYINYKEFNFLNPLANKTAEGNFRLGKGNIPLSWYSSFLLANLENIPEEYKMNNYEPFLNFLFDKAKETQNVFENKIFLLNNKMTEELNTLNKLLLTTQYHLQKANEMEMAVFAFYFYETATPNICVTNGREKFDIISKRKFTADEIQFSDRELFLSNQANCVHSKEVNTNSFLIQTKKKNNYQQHASTIGQFAERIITYKEDISLDIYKNFLKNNPKYNTAPEEGHEFKETYANQRIMEYFDFIGRILNETPKYKDIIRPSKKFNKVQIVTDKIQNYVLLKICTEIEADPNLTELDKHFNRKCYELQFIDPIINLKIKNEMLSQDQMDISLGCLESIDKEKNCNKILSYISTSIEVIQKMINFSSGKNDIGVDDFIQILVYLVIKSKPKYLISQIANCRYFLQGIIEKEKRGFDLSNLEVVVEFIFNASYEKLGFTSQEEMDKQASEYRAKYNE